MVLGHSAKLLAYWYVAALRNVVRIPELGHSAKLLAYWYGATLRSDVRVPEYQVRLGRPSLCS